MSYYNSKSPHPQRFQKLMARILVSLRNRILINKYRIYPAHYEECYAFLYCLKNSGGKERSSV